MASGCRIVGDGVLANGRVLRDTDVLVAEGRVIGLAARSAVTPDYATRTVEGFVAPGFVDIHTHGHGGVSWETCDRQALDEARGRLRALGVAGFLLSLASRPPEAIEARLRALAPEVGRREAGKATVLGIHLEGPYLALEHRGAHRPEFLRPPDPAEMARWLDLGRGTVRQVTLAPEQPRGMDVAGAVMRAGALAALGHCDANATQAAQAIACGVGHATHLWNGMSGVAHRGAGAAAAFLTSRSATAELIADGVHVDREILALTVDALGPARTCLVTDAIQATGLSDGDYTLGGGTIRVRGGVARTEDGRLAGSTLTMAAALRHLVGWGVADLAAAALMASATPASVIGAPARVGTFWPGAEAKLVRLAADGALLDWPEEVATALA
jgi:N-acetylglucosamine-6-phosphate deacetylase